MADVFDVAAYILNKQGSMSTWKLEKLCYYCQAWHYTWEEKPLFPNSIEAWANGPVCRDLFNKHRGRFIISPADFNEGNIKAFTSNEIESMDTVLNDYGNMTGYQLRELTHTEDPWKNARKGLPENAACSNIITLESMGLYYGSL